MGGTYSQMKKSHRFQLPSFLVLFAGFLLFWEWLRPLEQITDTGSSYLFVLYAFISFFVSYFVSNGWLKFLLKGSALLLVMDYVFLHDPFLSAEWLTQVSMEVSYNSNMLLNANWNELSPFFRSFLFLLLIWVISYLLHYWFVIANRFFLFVFLTIFYLAILDTFTVYDATIAIVRALIISLLALGLNHFYRMHRSSDYQPKYMSIWMSAVLFIVMIASVLGYYGPKMDPKWPDPVPFIESAAGHVGFGEGTVKKVGYGENDETLGGSFVADDTLVFEAIAKERLYWRIESKDVYTGKGWEKSRPFEFEPVIDNMIQFQTFDPASVDIFSSSVSVEYAEGSRLDKVPFPYGTTSIAPPETIALYQDFYSGMVEYEMGEQQYQPYFTMEYNRPSFSIDQLKNTSNEDPSEITEQYLQLPETLPDRVSQLAEEVVANLDNRLDKVEAIESYFSLNGYVYQTENIATPSGEEDYVDQFLFETMVGYCDNFSTSMVVLLRTLDIPARWVKGFTGGEVQIGEANLPSGYQMYEVTNNNAHSWVEVYFPEVGWVPFEPTRGFDNLTTFHEETLADVDQPELEEESTPEVEEQEEIEEEVTQEESEETNTQANDGNFMKVLKILGWIASGILVLSVIFIIIKRKDIHNWYLKRKWEKIKQKQDLNVSYHFLLAVLAKKGLKRASNETLRTYARAVDEKLGLKAMTELTNIYEQYVYSNKKAEWNEEQVSKLFHEMFEQVLA